MATWSELRLTGLARADLDRTAAILFELGCTGLQEDFMPGAAPAPKQPWDEHEVPAADPMVLTAWFEGVDRATVDHELAAVAAKRAWSQVDDADWVAMSREGFEPVVISERLVVATPWNAPEGALVIEPGQGFGTGDHPTTRQALVAVDQIADGLQTALDVGTGSGILAIAAARLGLRVTGIDIDAAAIEDAMRQAARNGVDVEFSTRPLATIAGPFDLVMANLHAEALVALVADLERVSGRHLILAGVLEDREAVVRAAFDRSFDLAHRALDGPWVALRYLLT